MTNNPLSLAIDRYICIIIEIGIILFILWSIIKGTLTTGVFLNVILATIGVICLIGTSEWLIKQDIKGATPLVLYKEGIRIKRFPLEKLLGAKECIATSQIKSVHVVRGSAVQGGRWGLTNLGTWHDAPIELRICRNDGSKYRTGTKLPIEVKKIADLMMTHWQVPVIDCGKGIGRFEPYKS